MPLNIIRNDITRVHADAIVNTANPQVAIGEGTDRAIYEAAGADRLLAARAEIGEMQPGQAAYTPAFGLHADHIIHTVGPVWRGGGYGERETVAACYRNSLRIADELSCESVAFPLISAGTYGFPKDEALKIAISEISSFLFTHDMNVLLVVYDRESFVISGKAFADVRSYIEEHEVRPALERSGLLSRIRRSMQRRDTGSLNMADPDTAGRDMQEADLRRTEAETPGSADTYQREDDIETSGPPDTYGSLPGFMQSEAIPDLDVEEDALSIPESPAASKSAEPYGSPKEVFPKSAEPFGSPQEVFPKSAEPYGSPQEVFPRSAESAAPKTAGRAGRRSSGVPTLEEILSIRGDTFQQVLLRTIDRKGMTDPEVYKRSNLDRKLFSKIRSDVNYNPSKRTVMALIIGLRLNLDEATDLLQKAGYSFSPSSVSDLTVRYCIEQQIYDIHQINCYLFNFGEKTLGA